MSDALFIGALRLVPKNLVSRLAGAATRWHAPAFIRHAAMRAFAARYGIDLGECPEVETYRTFGEFFARPLRPGLRPVAPGQDVVVSPVDGTVSEAGLSTAGKMLQAKGIDYSVEALVGDAALARKLEGGAWTTIYLSPKDYHRIHFPVGGEVTGWRYVPGKLWPVNPASVRTVPGLFTVNERLVTVLRTAHGLCAVVAVGATVVGRVKAYYDPAVPMTNTATRPAGRDYETAIPVEKGQELGAFEMGSTVILLFEPGKVALDARLAPGLKLRVGEPIGTARRG
ncbi:MAG: archaetidylserine decarboxylase [Anaeromyxobacter sp.]